MRQGRLHQIEIGPNVEPKGVIPLLVADLAQVTMGHLECRITHQDIDSAEFSSGSINHRSTMSRISQVTTHEYASATSVLNQTGDLSGVLVLIEIRDQHVCAFA